VSFDVAKVECDYAIEKFFLNRIFNRKAKHIRNPYDIGIKNFSKKNVRLKAEAFNRTFQSHFGENSSR